MLLGRISRRRSAVAALLTAGLLCGPAVAFTTLPELEDLGASPPSAGGAGGPQVEFPALLRDPSGLLALKAFDESRFAEAELAVRAIIARTPNVAEAWYLLGLILANQDRVEEAVDVLGKTAEMYERNGGPFVVQGDLFLSQGRIEEARAAYAAAVARDPEDWRPQESLGRLAEANGNRSEAIRRYEAALETLPPDSFDTRGRLARLYRMTGEPARAVALVERFVADNPVNADAMSALGQARYDAGDFAGAEQALQKAFELDPEDLGALLLMASSKMQQARFDEAEKVIAQVEALDPERPQTAFVTGRLENARGNPEAAIAAFTTAVDRGLPAAGVATHVARAQVAAGDAEAALETLTAATAAGAEAPAEVWLTLAELQAALGNLAESETTYAALTDIRPNSALAWFRLASARAAQGRYDVALEDYETGLALAPDDRRLLRGAALASMRAEQVDRAVAYGERFVEASDEAPASLMLLAWLHETAGDPAAAEADYRRILEADSGHGGALNNLSVLLVERGATDEAVAVATRATQAIPEAPYAWNSAGAAHLAAGQGAEAVAAFAEAVRLDPDNAGYLLDLGRSQIQAGDVETGRVSVARSLEMGLSGAAADEAQALLDDG